MKDPGHEPGHKDSGKPDKAGKNDRNRRDRKLRDTLGDPFLQLVPFLLVIILGWVVFSSMFGYRTIDTSDGLTLLRDKPGTIKSIIVVDGSQRVEMDLTTTYVQPKKKGIESCPVDKKVEFSCTDAQAEQVDRLMQAAASKEGFNSVVLTTSWWSSLIQLLVLALLLSGFMWRMLSRMGGGRGGAMGFGCLKAKVGSKGMPDVTFNDAAGEDEAVEELEEIRELLSESEKFRVAGAKTPKGILLYGPPGTGRTLLTKAVADEAGVPFFSMAASELVEMSVGVGASHTRDLFDQVKENAPAIIFVDEIDAVGRHRGSGTGGRYDEHEQTLNQLLVEMDGLDANTNVILIATTNCPDALDPALLHPGRFDRRVSIEALDMAGRTATLKVHAQGKPLNDDVDLELVTKRTPGFTGVNLVNVLNEAALLTARSNARLIDNRALDEAIDRVIAGPQKHTRVIRDHKKRITACHKAGHALCAAIGAYSGSVIEVTILPRGRALGYTQVMPQDDKYSTTRNELLDQLVYAMGGQAAEEVIFRDLTTGAFNNIEKATATACKIITDYGMTNAVDAVRLGTTESETVLRLDATSRDFSEQVAATVDTEVRNLLDAAHREAWEILTRNRAVLDQLAEEPLTRETLLEKGPERIFEGVTRQPERPLWRSNESLPVVKAAPASDQTGGESDDSHGVGNLWGYNHRAGPGPVGLADVERQRLTMSYDAEGVRRVMHDLFIAVGEDPERDRLRDTPGRMARAYAEMFAGLDQDPAEHVERVFDVRHEEMVLARDIPMYSVCKHHLLPFHGLAHVGYILSEDGCVTSLSKVARLVDGYARRPQVQERLTRQIAGALVEHLQYRGALVAVEAEHLCMSMRGVRRPGSNTVTSAVRGIMRNTTTRSEAMSLVLSQWS